MRKRGPTVEWQIAESDADWARMQGPPWPDHAPSARRRRPLPRSYWSLAALFLLLLSAGDWWWRSPQAHQAVATATAHRVLTAVADPAALDASRMRSHSDLNGWYQHEREVNGLRTAVQAMDTAGHVAVAVETVEVQGGYALARVVWPSVRGTPAYRQTRFYRRPSRGGWVPMAPAAALWGPKRRLETSYFVYHFREHDAHAILAVAPQVDMLYLTLRRNLGLAQLPTAEQLVIDVSVTHALETNLYVPHVYAQINVPSPAVYRAPVELRDDELLAQALVLPLLNDGLGHLLERQMIDQSWQPFLNGLRLWQVWDLDLPLAAWRTDIVQWLYRDLPASRLGQPVVLPARYPALCAAHQLWLASPAQIDIPLLCTERDQEDWFLAQWHSREPPRRLTQLAVPLRAKGAMMQLPALDGGSSPSQTVALATLIEYAVNTYGHEHLPVLVAGLGHYESWETLLPAVYGVSSAAFEASWQAYLTARYGV